MEMQAQKCVQSTITNQSCGLTIYLRPLHAPLVQLHTSEASLFPKLRDDFAEFLNEGSLERLRILSPPTCVGLRYGHPVSRLEVFPGSMDSGSSLR